jgi:phage recombination protein Bet
MNNAPTYFTRQSGAVTAAYTGPQLQLIRETVASRLNTRMFDQFMETAVRLRLDPLKKQLIPIVFTKRELDASAPKPTWKSVPYLTIVTTIDGLRSIAHRSGNYRPDNRPPRFVSDESLKGETNPLGLVSAEVSVFQFAHGEWFEAVGIAYWDEYAPVTKVGGSRNNDDPYDQEQAGPGKQVLDQKTQWPKRPRGMLAKCAEAIACRKGWPEDLSGVYAEEEMDRSRIIDGEVTDLTASQAAEAASVDRRLEAVGGKDVVLIDWLGDKGLEPTPVGQIADRCMAFIREHAGEVVSLGMFQDRNKHGLRQFYALSPNDAHAVKETFEAAIAAARKAAEETEPTLPLKETNDGG